MYVQVIMGEPIAASLGTDGLHLFTFFSKKTTRDFHPLKRIPHQFSWTQTKIVQGPITTTDAGAMLPLMFFLHLSGSRQSDLFGMMDVIQGGPGHPALPDGTPCKWKSPGIL